MAKHTVTENHPDCPSHLPHGVNDLDGHLLACKATPKEAQDLALHLDIGDAVPAPNTAPGDMPSVTAAADDPVPVVATATWPDVELVAAGEWDLSTGRVSFTTEDLQSAVAAAECPSVGAPILKLGHNDPRFDFDGEPAIGWVAGMRLNESLTKVVGDFTGMPAWLGDILPSAYPNRSVEGCWNFICQTGHNHPFVITAVALLGTTPPGVGVISSLNDIPGLYGLEAAAPADPAAAHPFTLTFGDLMPPDGSVLAAGTITTIDDVRREFYEEAPWSRWIVELQLDPLVLIVSDDSTGALYRIPVLLDPKQPGEVEFGPDETVLVQYVTAPNQTAEAAKGGPGRRIAAAWASRVTSRAGYGRAGQPVEVLAAWDAAAAQKALGDDPSSAQLKAMYALPADTKTGSKLPHHDCADGKVGAANADGCSAAIGAINGARGGLASVSADEKKKAYNHLAAHLKAAGQEPPEFQGSAADWPVVDETGDADLPGRVARLAKIRAAAGDTDADEDTAKLVASLDATLDQASALSAGIDRAKVDEPTGQALDLITAAEAIADQLMELLGITDPDDAAMAAACHGPASGEHNHPHPAFGSQGGDATHDHMHTHSNDAAHNHAHDSAATAAAGPATKGTVEKMDFTSEQLGAIRAKLGKPDDYEVTAADIAAAFAAPPIPATAAAAGGDGNGPMPKPDESTGMYLVDGSVIEDLRKRADLSESLAAELRRHDRDEVLAAAVRDGKFPQSRLEHYGNRWDSDPDGTREEISHLAAGMVPVGGPVGVPGLDQDLPGDFEQQQAYMRLYPEDVKAGRGARGGARA